MQNTSEQYDAIITECRDLFQKKMKDYGCAWRILRLPSLTDQIFIKAQRIRSLQQNAVRKVNEGEVSEFIGIINYCVMALIQIELGVAEQPDLETESVSEAYNSKILLTKQLMMDKNHDYGEAWRDMRVSSLTDLIIQKLLRVKQIEDNQGQTIISEGIDANYQDMVNYACKFRDSHHGLCSLQLKLFYCVKDGKNKRNKRTPKVGDVLLQNNGGIFKDVSEQAQIFVAG